MNIQLSTTLSIASQNTSDIQQAEFDATLAKIDEGTLAPAADINGDPIRIPMDDGTIWEITPSLYNGKPAYDIKIFNSDGDQIIYIRHEPGRETTINNFNDAPNYNFIQERYNYQMGYYIKEGKRDEILFRNGNIAIREHMDILDFKEFPPGISTPTDLPIDKAIEEMKFQQELLRNLPPADSSQQDTIPIS